MGGQTFDETNKLSKNDYDQIYHNIKKMASNNNLTKIDANLNIDGMIENIDYVLPFRLGNKTTYGDFDIILSDTDKFIDMYKLIDGVKIKEIKTIPLFEEKFNLYSKHILTDELFQIDLLKSWSKESIEITRAFYSYSFANVFLKRLAPIVDRNFKFSYLGLFCTNNKFNIDTNVTYIQIDQMTRLIIDPEYVFKLLDLSYDEYVNGFTDEVELLNYFKKSKYFEQISFKFNSKFKHDCKRLEPFRNLVNSGLINIENINKVNVNSV